jgi:uracil-DNA glycosylase family 4
VTLASRLSPEIEEAVRARIAYFRDLGVFDFYRRECAASLRGAEASIDSNEENMSAAQAELVESSSMPKAAVLPVIETPALPVAAKDKEAALAAIREDLGECTRCVLHKGRNQLVFGEGDANARLMFVGEGPGADEDAQGRPFVGRAGQLLNNMIAAMGLRREQVYIANIVKCRPPQNRVPELDEAYTCSPFLFRQIDVIRPEVIVALGSTAATYLLGGKSPLSALRGRLHQARGAKLIVTYHPAYLLRDPRQKKEAWADLQLAMAELGLKKAEKPVE